jgi:3-oxoacyl-[acyl-carrier protein] reductase
MSQKLAGKVAIVTGASKGIGAGIAKQLAAEGASVVVNYSSSKEGADSVANEIKKNGGKATVVKADVSKAQEVDRLFEETKKAYGRLDILVNNAGVYEFSPIADVTEEHYYKQFDLNVLGLLLASKKAADHFGPEGGSIVNISSVVSSLAPPNSAVYSGTKGAVDSITRTLANELGPRKIRVNAINPGMVVTEGVQAAGFDNGDFRKEIESKTPLGRIGQVEDVAPAAVFFASPEASWITGETLVVSGGIR